MVKLGLIGEKLGHSLSPKIHNFIFKKTGLVAEYSLYEFDRSKTSEIFNEMLKKGINGFNITVPYKEIFFNHLDYISDEAKEIGAINTVAIINKKAYGYNTDYYGVIKIFNLHNFDVKNKVCYILGSGGACKAVIVALKNLEAKKIIVVTRDLNKINSEMKKNFPYIDIIEYSDIGYGDIIINTTPVGMYPNIESTPLDEKNIIKFKIAIDLIYNPYETKFLNIAKNNGLKTANGLSMLIEQAIKAEEIWQNIKLDEKLYNELEEYLLEERI